THHVHARVQLPGDVDVAAVRAQEHVPGSGTGGKDHPSLEAAGHELHPGHGVVGQIGGGGDLLGHPVGAQLVGSQVCDEQGPQVRLHGVGHQEAAVGVRAVLPVGDGAVAGVVEELPGFLLTGVVVGFAVGTETGHGDPAVAVVGDHCL